MHARLLIFCFVLFQFPCFAQDLYFPPFSGNSWATTSLEELNWNRAAYNDLVQFLDQTNTKAFLVLKDGKIVIENYFDDFTADSLWVWNSAAKGITAVLVGIAQHEGLLSIEDKTSDYLGEGWTSMVLEKENLIKVKNQLSMSSGMNELFFSCTGDSCLRYVADAGTRWAYHNSPYTLLRNVVEQASGLDYNVYTIQKLHLKMGMGGLWVKVGDNNIYVSKPRHMARFGLMVMNKGVWDGDTVLGDTDYWQQMITPSQGINQSYGFLWWLNGQPSHMVPVFRRVYEGWIAPDAPEDLYAAIGKNAQILDVVPSQNLVVVRMGDAPNEDFVPVDYHNEMWQKIMPMLSNTTTINPQIDPSLTLYPNPFKDEIQLQGILPVKKIYIRDQMGRIVAQGEGNQLNTASLSPALYLFEIEFLNGVRQVHKVLKQ